MRRGNLLADRTHNNVNKYSKLIKALQIVSFAFMLVLCIIFIVKNNISVKIADKLTQYLTGRTLTMALIVIGFSFVKSFALVFLPAVCLYCQGLFL